MEKKGLPEQIKRKLAADEMILWWAKPCMTVLTHYEKKEIAALAMLPLAFILFEFFLDGKLTEIYDFLIAIIFFGIILICYYLKLLTGRTHTWFLITDRRALYISTGFISRFIEKPLTEIRRFEIVRSKSTSSIYLGDYRLISAYKVFDYLTGKEDWFNTNNNPRYNKNKFLLRFLNFYAVKEAEKAIFVLRAHTNAVEYIEPKRNKGSEG